MRRSCHEDRVCSEGVWHVVNQPERALVSRVEMRPARVARA